MESLIGQTLGQYQIVEQIGQGGMATVFKAYQPSLDRYVAVKILPAYYAHEPGFAERFTREAHAIAQLDHPNILSVYDSGKQDNISYIVMKYVTAGSLKDKLGQPLSLVEASQLIDQIAGALDAAHERGILHRDVKPGNILIDERGWIYLSDFGLAKMVEGSIHLTGTGVGVGTPSYMSPEQGQGLPVDARTDVYALGVILYEMLTGHVPYAAETPVAVVIKHVNAPIPLIRQDNPNIPTTIERVLLKTLAKNRDDRFASAGAMAAALRQAVQDLETDVTAAPLPADFELTRVSSDSSKSVPEPVVERKKMNWLPLVLGALIALIGGIGLFAGSIYLTTDNSPPVVPPTIQVANEPAIAAATEENLTVTPVTTVTVTFSPSLTDLLPTQTPTQMPPTELPPSPTPTISPTLTPTPIWNELREDFTDLNQFTEYWDSFTNNGRVSVGDGFLSLVADPGPTFPYVRLRQPPLPAEGDVTVKIEFQYTQIGILGSGIMLGSGLVENESPLPMEFDPSSELFKIWQDDTFYNALVIGASNSILASRPTPDMNQHTVHLVFQSGQVDFYLDGVLIETVPEPSPRPSTMWFGNPYRVADPDAWSAFKVFSLSIESGANPPAPPTPTPLPPTPTPCSREAQGVFRAVWLKYKDRLGCPHQTEPIGGFYAEQPFENGHMFWSQQGQLYLILIGSE